MENHQDARFDKLEALIEKRFADIKAELKEMHRQGEVKDMQIAALLERVREANAMAMRAVVQLEAKDAQIDAFMEHVRALAMPRSRFK